MKIGCYIGNKTTKQKVFHRYNPSTGYTYCGKFNTHTLKSVDDDKITCKWCKKNIKFFNDESRIEEERRINNAKNRKISQKT